jgi:hypothetical protein
MVIRMNALFHAQTLPLKKAALIEDAAIRGKAALAEAVQGLDNLHHLIRAADPDGL